MQYERETVYVIWILTVGTRAFGRGKATVFGHAGDIVKDLGGCLGRLSANACHDE